MKILSKLKKALYIVAAFTFLTASAYSISSAKDGWQVVHSNKQSLTLVFKPDFVALDTIDAADGQRLVRPKFTNATSLNGGAGAPTTYVGESFITVPNPEGFELIDYDISGFKKIPVKIVPYPMRYKLDGNYHAIYITDEQDYRRNNNIVWAKLSYSGISRHRHLAKLQLIAAKYSSEQKAILIPKKITVEIKFNSQSEGGAYYNNERIFDPPLSLNHNETKSWLIKENLESDLSLKKSHTQSETDADWVKIKIEEEGVYQITAGKLNNLGFLIPKEDIHKIKIYGNGGLQLSENVTDAVNNEMNEQEIIVKKKGDGTLDKIIFYASPASGFKYDSANGFRHYINHFSENSYYMLTWSGDSGKRAEPIVQPTYEADYEPNTYTRRIFYEEEMHNAYIAGSGRAWFGRNLLPAVFVERLNNLKRDGEIFYRFSVAHRAPYTGTFDIYENDNKLCEAHLKITSGHDDAEREEVTAKAPASYVSADNRSSLKFEYTNYSGDGGAQGYFDWYEIHYPAYLEPINNELSFFSNPENDGVVEYLTNGFSGGEIYGFETTDAANPKLIENKAVTGGMFRFKNETEANRPKKFFISSKIKEPSLQIAEFANLRGESKGSDLILITHKDLLESANNYKEYREERSNISVFIATLTQIYNEYNSGTPDPTAIRDFIADAFDRWERKPKYVLLWGDGHYDYKLIGTDEKNYAPTYQIPNSSFSYDEIDSYTSDDFFANIAGDDDLIDIALGRIPVQSNGEGNWMIEKIGKYENESSEDSWRTNITVVADDSWKKSGSTDGTLHTNDAEQLCRNHLPNFLRVNKIYMAEYPSESVTGGKRKPRVTQEMLSASNNDGNLFLCYIGHGNPRVWAHEEILERSLTIPQFTNLDKLFFATAASCDFGRFDSPEIRSGAEELLLSERGGAIGVFSSTRLVFADPNARLNETLYRNFFEKNEETGEYFSLGVVNMITKYEKYKRNDKKYCLLGDPTIKILIPEYNARINKINDVNVSKGDTAKLKGLSEVTIEGSVTSASSTVTDETFNGTAIITMLDSDKQIRAFEDDGSPNGTTHHFTKYGGTLNQSSCEVKNGKFTSEFIIPKDISFSGEPGRLLVYAYSDDDRFAKGDTRKFIIDGLDTTTHADSRGPEIEVYLDSKEFVSGDYVSCEPTLIVELSDESGINATGIGLGHNIEAWIDDARKSIDLTDNFSASFGDSRSGEATKILYDLEPGLHKIKIRAWDVFNNFSITETYFRTASCDGLIIHNLTTYPNPASSSLTFSFNHTINPPFDYEITVRDALGRIVSTLSSEAQTKYKTEIRWNCQDDNGKNLTSGAYYYRLKAINKDGIMVESTNFLNIIK